MSPVGSTLSPRRTTTRRCDGMITMRWPRSPDAKNASRGIPSRTRALGVGVLAAIGPEAGGVIGVERGCGAEIHPVLMQDAFSADHAVIEVEQAELRPVPRACEHVGRALQRARAVEFQRDVAHAERVEQFAPRKGQRLLRPADGIADDARQDLRGRARVMPSRAQRRDHLGLHGIGGRIILQITSGWTDRSRNWFHPDRGPGHAHEMLDLDLATRIASAAPFRNRRGHRGRDEALLREDADQRIDHRLGHGEAEQRRIDANSVRITLGNHLAVVHHDHRLGSSERRRRRAPRRHGRAPPSMPDLMARPQPGPAISGSDGGVFAFSASTSLFSR